MKKYRKGDQIHVVIDKVVYKGIGIGRHEGIVVFVHNAYPGEEVLADVTNVKRDYLKAKAVEVISSAELRTKPECSHFGNCGGCTWQDIPYSKQLEFKRKIVEDSFSSIGKLKNENLQFNETIPSVNPFHYRNKMEFSFKSEDGKVELGLHQRGRYDQIVTLDECGLLPPKLMEITHYISDWMNQNDIQVYDQETKEGLLRFCTLRYSFANDEVMVILTTKAELAGFRQFAADLMEKFPITVSVHSIVNDSLSEIAMGRVAEQAGNLTIREKICGYEFEISPFSFFQPNPQTAELLFNSFLERVNFSEASTIFDLFAGTGTIGIICSRYAEKVYCIESEIASVEDGRRNAAINQVDNVEFIGGEVHLKLPELKANGIKPDLVILDPPRAGLRKKSIKALLEAAPKQLVYISCNPTTQARDLAILAEKYSIDFIQPVDMFPQTYHIENVVILRKIDY